MICHSRCSSGSQESFKYGGIIVYMYNCVALKEIHVDYSYYVIATVCYPSCIRSLRENLNSIIFSDG